MSGTFAAADGEVALTDLESDHDYLRGQLHAHSSGSNDSDTDPEDVLLWYREHGFDFVVLTDHNHVTAMPSVPGVLGVPGVELTFNTDECEPAPEPGRVCSLHVNALFLASDWRGHVFLELPDSLRRLDIFRRSLSVARELGGLVQVNHPNFNWSVDADLLVALAAEGAQFVEIANQSVLVHSAGDANHPSAVSLWDAALTAGARLWGVATDDAHHYDDAAEVAADGDRAHTGNRGWVMVRAAREPAAIRGALARGEFYASTGVTLSFQGVEGDIWRLAVAGESPGPHTFRLIGAGGAVLDEARGRAAEFDVGTSSSPYLRVEVQDPSGRTAWTQPIWP